MREFGMIVGTVLLVTSHIFFINDKLDIHNLKYQGLEVLLEIYVIIR